MSTHATITIKSATNETHLQMIGDGYPRGFSDEIQTALKPDLQVVPQLDQHSFSPLLRNLTQKSRLTITTHADDLGDAWYRYELDERSNPPRVKAFGRNLDEQKLPSLHHGWREIFSGTLDQFSDWSKKFNPENEYV